MKTPDLKDSVGRMAEMSPCRWRASLFKSGRILSLNQIIPSATSAPAINTGLSNCMKFTPEDFSAVISKSELNPDAQRMQHRHLARRAPVEVVAQAVLQQGDVNRAVVLGHADTGAEIADGLRGVPAPPQAGERRHARIVPASDMALVHQLEQLALAQDGVRQVQARELDLARVVDLQRVRVPVVERAMVL